MHPIFCVHLIIFLGLLNLDIITSTPPLECLHCLFVCNLQFRFHSFIFTLCIMMHNDCSPIEDMHRRRRSRAEFGLVLFGLTILSKIQNLLHEVDECREEEGNR